MKIDRMLRDFNLFHQTNFKFKFQLTFLVKMVDVNMPELGQHALFPSFYLWFSTSDYHEVNLFDRL